MSMTISDKANNNRNKLVPNKYIEYKHIINIFTKKLSVSFFDLKITYYEFLDTKPIFCCFYKIENKHLKTIKSRVKTKRRFLDIFENPS